MKPLAIDDIQQTALANIEAEIIDATDENKNLESSQL